MAALVMPRDLEIAARGEGRQWWLATLAGTVADLERRWSLKIGRPFQPGGQTAWVAPAHNAAGSDVVVKLAWRHTEAAHEADALILWNGEGAVRLHEVEHFEHTIALLLERCQPGCALAMLSEEEQDVVVANLLRRLWLQPPPGHPFRPLSVMCNQWADEFEAKTGAAKPVTIDPGVVRLGIELFRALATDGPDPVLLGTDLHAGNVLAARRQPWLVIDPNPYVGDPAYDLLQHMLNCPPGCDPTPTDCHGGWLTWPASNRRE
jgi:streptomycin 6-kinase